MTHPTGAGAPSPRYDFSDGSLARPWLTRFWFARVFPLLPRWLAANVVTFASTGVLLAVVALSLTTRGSATVRALVVLVALQVYVAGDHLDGMQAKATGTAGPLGDFLDHYCDFWAGAMLILGFWTLLGDVSRAVLHGMTAVLALGFAITYAEREARRTLRFTALGTLEAIVLLTLFLLSWMVPWSRDFWRSEALPGLAWYWLPIVVSVTMALAACAEIIRRMGGVPRPVLALTVESVLLGWILARTPAPHVLEGWLLFPLLIGDYVARVMHGHVRGGEPSRSDPVPFIALLAMAGRVAFAPPASLAVPYAALIVYLTVRNALTLVPIVRSLRGLQRR